MNVTLSGISRVAGSVALAAMVLAPAASTAKPVFKTIYSFCSSGSDCSNGARPMDGMIMDSAGNLYGVTIGGGSKGAGTVFKLSPNADKTVWTETVLHSFSGQAGSQPRGPLIMDTTGNLYGTTSFGNASFGAGLVFEVMNDANHTFQVLYNFCPNSGCVDGAEPRHGLTYAGQTSGALYDGASQLYGTTHGGGTNNTGVAFRLFKSGSKWKEFPTMNAAADEHAGMVVADNAGNLTLSTEQSTPGSDGRIYKGTPDGSGGFSWSKFYDFCKGACKDGADPSGIAIDTPGNIYGATFAKAVNGKGDLFRIGTNKKFKSYHEFCPSAGCADGRDPFGPTLTASGTMYGVTRTGGGHNIDHDGTGGGTIYQVVGGKFKKLYSFCAKASCLDGENPFGSVVVGGDGTIYGITNLGGANAAGEVFSYKP